MTTNIAAQRLKTTLGTTLKRLREIRGFNQKEIATQMGMNQSAFSRIEHGKNSFTADSLARAAVVLRCEPWELLKPGYEPRHDGLSDQFRDAPTAHDLSLILSQLLNVSPERRAKAASVLFDDSSWALR